MGNITLTKIMFAALIGTFIIAILFNAYVSFAFSNNAQIQEPYNSVFRNISSQYNSFAGLANKTGDQGLVTNIYDAGKAVITGTVNVFVVGLNAIGTFFEMIPLIGNVLSAIALGIPWLGGLISLATTLLVLYIGMRYIQSASNKQDLP